MSTNWGTRHRDRFLGPERAARVSPLRSALDRGIRFGGHSDWWVTPVDPLFNVHVAANRRTREGDVLGSEFTITSEQALRAMTLDAAWLGFEETSKGSLEVGKLGDLVVLSDDPLGVAPEAIDDINIDYAVIGGRVVYDRAVDGGSRRDERRFARPSAGGGFHHGVRPMRPSSTRSLVEHASVAQNSGLTRRSERRSRASRQVRGRSRRGRPLRRQSRKPRWQSVIVSSGYP